MSWTCFACTLVNSDASSACEACGVPARTVEPVAPRAAAFARLDDVPEVGIDADGVFKYIQVRVKHAGGERTLVRGHAWAEYHADVLQHYKGALAALPGVEKVSCPGGGRIAVDADLKQVRVYGHSIGFGRAEHALTAAALARALPAYTITHDDTGY